MSQPRRLVRARQLTASVLPGRKADGNPDQAAARLLKLAQVGSTGTLPFSGSSEGAIFFRDGKVAFAESTRTPGPADRAYSSLPADNTPFGQIAATLAIAEPTVDAVLDLLSSESRYARFRPSRVAHASGPGILVEALLAEVARRQRVLSQLEAVLTTDTAVARNPRIRPESVRVSALQWALLIRVQPGATPRRLAWDVSRSVFATTTEVYRLLMMRLLTVPGRPDPGSGRAVMSFVRASADRLDDHAQTAAPDPSAGTALTATRVARQRAALGGAE